LSLVINVNDNFREIAVAQTNFTWDCNTDAKTWQEQRCKLVDHRENSGFYCRTFSYYQDLYNTYDEMMWSFAAETEYVARCMGGTHWEWNWFSEWDYENFDNRRKKWCHCMNKDQCGDWSKDSQDYNNVYKPWRPQSWTPGPTTTTTTVATTTTSTTPTTPTEATLPYGTCKAPTEIYAWTYWDCYQRKGVWICALVKRADITSWMPPKYKLDPTTKCSGKPIICKNGVWTKKKAEIRWPSCQQDAGPDMWNPNCKSWWISKEYKKGCEY
jgi:hypothetical protein